MPRRFIPYRRDLKRPSQSLRRDPTPAERKLWYEFLRTLPIKFTRQKPLGHYIADFYCASERLVIELGIRGDTRPAVHQQGSHAGV
jgi:very-short-patch-repair endonuclease